jgi:hypothetical protein
MATGLILSKSDKAKRRLEDIQTSRVDLVDRAANKKRFLVFKMEDPMPGTGVDQFTDTTKSTLDLSIAIAKLDAAKTAVMHLTKCMDIDPDASPEDISKADEASTILKTLVNQMQDLGARLEKSEDLTQEILTGSVANLTKTLADIEVRHPSSIEASAPAEIPAEPNVPQVVDTKAVAPDSVSKVEDLIAPAVESAPADVPAVVETPETPSYQDTMISLFADLFKQATIQKSADVSIEQILAPSSLLAAFETRLTDMGYIEKKVAPATAEAPAIDTTAIAMAKTAQDIAKASDAKIDAVVPIVTELTKQVAALIEHLTVSQATIAKSRNSVPARAGESEHMEVTRQLPKSLLFPGNFNDPAYKKQLEQLGIIE